jgi:hypothetical protein
MDISFNCAHCNQRLAVDELGAGMTVNCPNCNQPVEIPHSAAPPPPVPIPVPAIQQATASWKAKRKEIDVKEYKVLTQKDRFFGGKEPGVSSGGLIQLVHFSSLIVPALHHRWRG